MGYIIVGLAAAAEFVSCFIALVCLSLFTTRCVKILSALSLDEEEIRLVLAGLDI